nr:UBN2 domain-containing protein [Tanacetum cinerariifolium]
MKTNSPFSKCGERANISTHDDVIVQDEGIEDVNEEKVVEVVTTAKMIIVTVVDVAHVTTAIADIPVSAAKTIVTTAPTITAESTKTNVENRIAIEKAKQVEEVNLAWDDVQAKIKVDYQLAQRLQAEEQEQLTDAKKAKLFMEFLEKRRKFFAAKRAEEKRNKPPTKAQQRSLMCTYLKNMDGWKTRALKNKSFAEIQELFDKAMKRINTFVDFKNELNVEDDKESNELKKCLEIIPDNGDEVTINATPLSYKSPTIVDYKIYKEGKKNYFQIFKADGYSSNNYVRKFLRALHPKWRAKVMAIKESKDLTSLSLDEPIKNLKVHETIIKKDYEIVKAKGERKSLDLKAKKESSDEECLISGNKDEEYAMAVRDFNKFFKRRECPKPPKDKNQRAFVGGSWSVSGEEDDEKDKDDTCLVAQASNEVKNKQEPDKIEAKPDQIKKKREAWQSPEKSRAISVKKARKMRKYKSKGPKVQNPRSYMERRKERG